MPHMRTAWTSDQDAQLRAGLRAERSLDSIAQEMGRSIDTLRHHAKRLGIELPSRRRRVWGPERDRAMEELCRQGLPRRLIAEKLGVTVPALVSRANTLGLWLAP